MNSLVPILYYPFKAMIVDDNLDLLDSLKQALSNKFDILTVELPQQALQILKKQAISMPNLFKDTTHTDDLNLSQDGQIVLSTKFTFQSILDILNDKDKYCKYGTLITDFEMPLINGIELCDQIRNTAITKILLTGKYGSDSANEAFNKKLIDGYITKGSEHTLKQLDFFLAESPMKYFKALTNSVLSVTGCDKFPFLLDQNFAKFINDKIKELAITEYYMIDSNGSYLLLNQDNRYVLAVYTEQSLSEFCDLYAAEPEAKSFIELIKQKTHIPFFGVGKSSSNVNFVDWDKHFYQANQYGKYHWSLVKLN